MTQATRTDRRTAGQSTSSTKSRVAVVYATPETVLDDVGRAMRLAGYRAHLPVDIPTLLKINISWQHYYPACSTTPWQMEGVIKTLRADGYTDLVPTHNGTVVVDAREGAVRNKHTVVEERYGLDSVHLESEPWVRYEPKAAMSVLHDVYPEGIYVPQTLIGKNIVHLPTMKTHVFTTITGAMKNAFGGLLNHRRHWTHSVIHETLVDLLRVQREIHPGIFAVTDGTFVGDGPGPRAMRWHVKNVMIAGADQVAVDAVSARMMGFDPMSIDFLRLGHEAGLGCADTDDIEVVGEDISEVSWGLRSSENTLASRGQKLIYWGPLKPLERALLRTPIVPWAYLASNLYHNEYWLRFIGRRRVREAMKTGWGRLFQSY